MSAQHTPGPWKDGPPAWFRGRMDETQGKRPINSDDPKAGVIANVYGEANARLIAAAPDLLAAAERALNFIENTEGEMSETLPSGDLLRAAIAKAKGSAA